MTCATTTAPRHRGSRTRRTAWTLGRPGPRAAEHGGRAIIIPRRSVHAEGVLGGVFQGSGPASLARLARVGVAVALIVAVVLVFIVGRPPHTFRIAAGAPGGAYMAFAEALRDDLAARGLGSGSSRPAGSVDNVPALLESGGTDVGLVQSGTDSFVDMTGLTARSPSCSMSRSGSSTGRPACPR